MTLPHQFVFVYPVFHWGDIVEKVLPKVGGSKKKYKNKKGRGMAMQRGVHKYKYAHMYTYRQIDAQLALAHAGGACINPWICQTYSHTLTYLHFSISKIQIGMSKGDILMQTSPFTEQSLYLYLISFFASSLANLSKSLFPLLSFYGCMFSVQVLCHYFLGDVLPLHHH